MLITEAKFTQYGLIQAKIDGVERVFPDDPKNRFRQALALLEKDGLEIAAFEISLDDAIRGALETARETTNAVRSEIARSATTDRALAWLLKAMFAAVSRLGNPADDALIAQIGAAAAQGFALEASITGDDAGELEAKSLQNAIAFNTALHLVEGMERKAEAELSAVTTHEELAATVETLRALEAQARAQLQTLQEDPNNA